MTSTVCSAWADHESEKHLFAAALCVAFHECWCYTVYTETQNCFQVLLQMELRNKKELQKRKLQVPQNYMCAVKGKIQHVVYEDQQVAPLHRTSQNVQLTTPHRIQAAIYLWRRAEIPHLLLLTHFIKLSRPFQQPTTALQRRPRQKPSLHIFHVTELLGEAAPFVSHRMN